MHVININPLQAGALPQQAQPGALSSAPQAGALFSSWLSPPGLGQLQAGRLPESVTAAQLQLIWGPVPVQQAAAQQLAAVKPDMLQVLCHVLRDTVRELLDAAPSALAAGPVSQQGATAGETATPDQVVRESTAGVVPGFKHTAVLWGQDADGMSAQREAAGVATAAANLQYLLEHWPQLVARLQSVFVQRFGLSLSLVPVGLSAWAAKSAAVPWSNVPFSADNTFSELPVPLQAWLNQADAGPQQLPATAQGCAIPLSAAQLEGLSNAPASIRWFAAGGSVISQALALAEADQAATQQAPLATTVVQLADGSTLRLAVVAGSQASQQDLAGLKLHRPAGLPALPAGSGITAGQVVREASGFTVALYSPAEELPLLTARLVVERVAEPPLRLPAMVWPEPAASATLQAGPDPADPASRLELPAPAAVPDLAGLAANQVSASGMAAAGSLAVQLPLQHVTPSINATQRDQAGVPVVTATAARSRLGHNQPSNWFKPEAPASAELRSPHLADAASKLTPDAAASSRHAVARQAQRISLQTLDLATAQLTAHGTAEQPAGRDSLAQAAAEAHPGPVEPVPAASPVLLSRAGAAVAPVSGFTPLGSDRPPAGAPGRDAVQSYTSQLGGLAFGLLPAQLMQFSSRELTQRPYAGLEFHELATRLLEQTVAARSQGDGLYRLTLELNPPSLGRMSVNIAVRGDNVALQLAVVSAVPREQLKGNLAALRQSLEEAGLNVVELQVVTVDPDGQPARQYHEQQTQPQPEAAADDDALSLAFSQALSASNA